MLRTHAESQQAHFSPKNLCAQRVLQKTGYLLPYFSDCRKSTLPPDKNIIFVADS